MKVKITKIEEDLFVQIFADGNLPTLKQVDKIKDVYYFVNGFNYIEILDPIILDAIDKFHYENAGTSVTDFNAGEQEEAIDYYDGY